MTNQARLEEVMASDEVKNNTNNSNTQHSNMDPCSLPTGSANTSIAQAVSATRVAQRANFRSRATEGSSSTAAGSASMNDRTSPVQQQQRSQTRSPRFLDGDLQGPSSIPLTEMLRSMQLPLYRGHRPAPPLRRLLTNEDIIATIDEVLELVGDDALPLPSTQDSRRNLGNQPLDR